MEKGYRHWGHDIADTDTPIEAGLGFAIKWEKKGGFIGRDALARQRAEGPPRRRLVQFLLEDPEPLLHHGEVIWRDGARVGYVRVGAYGFTLGAAVGLGMVEAGEPVDRPYVESGSWEIEIAGRRLRARASLQPFYDPQNKRIRV